MGLKFTNDELNALEDFIMCVIRRRAAEDLPDTRSGNFEKEMAEQALLHSRMRLKGE